MQAASLTSALLVTVSELSQAIATPNYLLDTVSKEVFINGGLCSIRCTKAVHDPEYIFFDEATSALDANNEKVIMETLEHFLKVKPLL